MRADFDRLVHLLYLDEAGTPVERELVLGGVAVDASRWAELRSRWRAVVRANGGPPEAEVKWGNMNRDGDLAKQLADVLAERGVTAFAVELQTLEGRIAAPALFASPDDVYATALMFIAERFQRFLVHVGDYGAIILNHREGTQDERLRRFFRRLVENGTPYTRLERLLPCFARNPHTGAIDGVGIKRFPDPSLAAADKLFDLRATDGIEGPLGEFVPKSA